MKFFIKYGSYIPSKAKCISIRENDSKIIEMCSLRYLINLTYKELIELTKDYEISINPPDTFPFDQQYNNIPILILQRRIIPSSEPLYPPKNRFMAFIDKILSTRYEISFRKVLPNG